MFERRLRALRRNRILRDIVVLGLFAVVATVAAVSIEGFELLYEFSREHEDYEIDEILTVGIVGSLALMVFAWRRVQDQRREINARRTAEERAKRLANADTLTGLANRRRLEAALRDALSGASEQTKRAVMIVDLNRFKPINDIFGHVAGDEALVEVANRLRQIADEETLIARLGGDEFALLTGPIADTEPAARLARRVIAALGEPIRVGAAEAVIGAGIGIAVAPDDADGVSDLLRRADIALYRAKRERQSAFHFFEEEMDRSALRRSRIERDMREALAAGEIRPFYQPIVSLRDETILGFEALARWTHPEFGEIEPEEFIGIAEDCGIISELTNRILEVACLEAAHWPADATLSVNISPVEISDPVLVLRIMAVLGKTGFDPRRLEIELTENALVADFEASRSTLSALQDAGVRIALDDFGTGNSSLNHLRKLTFNEVKIDRSFIAEVATSKEASEMVRAILGLAKALDLTTAAEGTEALDQVEWLVAEGCSQAQGFHYAEALPPEQALRLIAERAPRASA